jgi:hypothetical protein
MHTRADTYRPDITAALRRMGLCESDEKPALLPLSGGVSCDIFRADLARGSVCAKQALPRLRVAADWYAPVERNHVEVEWLRFTTGVDPRLVPEVLGEDREACLFAMRYLPPERYPCWKTLLMEGEADTEFAAAVGKALAGIHAASAGNQELAERFDRHDFFRALRIEPYLLHAAEAHTDLAPRIGNIAGGIARSRIALMHGDVSPKNILCGPDGPVFLDAETACYGDPAFDLAFCLNHLLLKCVYSPAHAAGYAACFQALRGSYLEGVTWEAPHAFEARVAAILPALLLARIDGKSPVEFLTAEDDKNFVRQSARQFFIEHITSPSELLLEWRERMARR